MIVTFSYNNGCASAFVIADGIIPLPLELDVSGQTCDDVIDLVEIGRLAIAFTIGVIVAVVVVVMEVVFDDNVVLLFGTD